MNATRAMYRSSCLLDLSPASGPPTPVPELWDSSVCATSWPGVSRLHAPTAASYVVSDIGRRGRFDCRAYKDASCRCRQRRQTMGDATFTALSTGRLVLRRFRPGDLDALVAYRSDPATARYQSWEAPYRPSQA